MKLRIAALLGLLFAASCLSSQTTPNLEVGYTLFGSFHGSDIDQVNLNNGKLEMRIPLLSYPQRGGKLHVGFSIHYSSPVYTETNNCYPIGPGNTNVCAHIWDWSGPPLVDVVPDFGMLAGGGVIVDGGAQLVTASVTSFDGSVHQMGNLDNTFNQTNGYRASTWEASDGSKIKLENLADKSSIIIDSDGTRYRGSGGLMEDANGNQVTWGSSGYVDTVGRQIPLPPRTDGSYPAFNGNATLCPTGPLPTIGAAAWSVPGYNTPTVTITFCYALVNISPPLPGTPPPPNFPDPRTPGGSYPLLQSVVLPPQPGQPAQAYTFQYDTASGFGDLIKVALPSGGSISYGWGEFHGCHYPPKDEIDLENPAIGTRTVYDGTSSNTWTYAIGNTRVGSTNQTSNTATVTDPAGNQEIHTFSALAGCSFYETQKDSDQLVGGTQSPLKSVKTQYSSQLDPNAFQIPASAINVLPTVVTTSWAGGQTSSVEKQYDSGFTLYGAFSTITAHYGSLISEKQHDFGQGTAGAVIRQDNTAFQWQMNPTYLTDNLMDIPYQQQVLDGAGNLAAQTTFYYDGATTPNSAPSSPVVSGFGIGQELDTFPVNGSYRGNPTSVTRYLNTGTSPTTTNVWYDTGEMQQSTDPGNHITTFTYDTSHGAFLTQTCLPTTGGIAHCTGGGYDTNTGLLTSFTDQNSQGTTYGYDTLLRLHSVGFPDGGGRTYTYTDGSNPRVDVSEIMDSSTNITSSVLFDGLGRKKQTQLTSDPEGIDYADTMYDSLGRIGSVSNPYRTTPDPTNGTMHYTYDALGRTTQVTKQDSDVVSTDYSAFPTVTATDETGRQRRSRSDALGRILEVDEPGWFSGSPAYGSISIGSVNSNGADQSVQVQSAGATQATGWVLISGSEKPAKRIPCTNQAKVQPTLNSSSNPPGSQSAPIAPLYPCYITAYDSGGIGVTVNGIPAGGVNWGKGSDSGTMSTLLINSINQNTSSPVTASPNGSYVMLTSKAYGAGANYSLSVSAGNDDPTDWPVPSFSVGASGPYLTGAANATYTTVYDSGSVTVTVSGSEGSVTESAPYNQSSSQSSIAGALAAKFNSDGNTLVTAGSSGNSLNFTAKTNGASISYSISGSSGTSQGQYFASPSYSAGTGGISGGQNAGPGGLAHPFVTTYQYDTLGNLIGVNQQGDGSAPRTRSFVYDTLSRLTSATNPESGTTQYAYTIDSTCNPDGLLRTQTDARAISTTYCYDQLHRVTTKSFSDSTLGLTYIYDTGGWGGSANGIGRLVHETNFVNAAMQFSYDQMGRIVTETECLPSTCGTTTFPPTQAQYDQAGYLIWLTYPSGRKIHNSYNQAGRLKLVNFDSFNGAGVNYAYYTMAQGTSPTTWGYTPSGALQLGNYGNGVQQSLGYNNRLQMTAISQSFSGTTLFSKSYTYTDATRSNGNNGNVIAINDNLTATRNQTFGYDDLNRLTSASQADGAFSQTFTIDPWGNTQQAGTWNFQQAFAANNRIATYSYDGAGDVTYDGFHNYTYDAEHRLTTVDATTATYTYGPDGERVRKDTGGSFTEYIYFAGEPIAEKTASGWTDYIFDGSERIALATGTTSAGTQYYHADHLGSERLMTDASGTVISNCLFAPFGQQVSCSPDNPANHYKFTGKERDGESGLDYFGARFYSSNQGRWLIPDWSASPEAVPYADFSDPRSLNLYGYVKNNPMSHADADGHACPGCLGETGIVYIPSGSVSGELDRVQTTLSAASFLPGAVGRVAAAVNAGISFFRGNNREAAGNALAAAIPGGGKLSKAEQIIKNAAVGKAAEKAVGEVLTKEGSEILGKQVGVQTSQGLRKVDYLAKTPGGEIVNIEAKSENASRTTLQEAKDAEIENRGGTYVGKNAPEDMRGQTVQVPTKVRRPGDVP